MKASYRLYILLLNASLPLFAQQTPAPSAPPSSGDTNPLITLDAVVTNKSGTPQSGLQQQDFTLLDNKTSQKIVSFHAIETPAAPAVPPVEVVLCIDTVNTAIQTVLDERSQIQKYLRQNGGKLTNPTSVVIFSDSGLKNLGAPTLDGNALGSMLDGNDIVGFHAMQRASGSNGAFERLTSSLSKLYSLAAFEEKKPGRKMVIWISPGWPLLASVGTEMYSKGKEQLFSTLVLVSTAIKQARITLYSIDPEGAGGSGLRSRFSYESYLKGVSTAKDVSPPNLSLQVLVTRSGGRVLTTGNDIGSQIADCLSDIKAFYVLSFETVPTERPDEYHSLELKVDKPGLIARTSAGYYAQPIQRPGAAINDKKK